MTTTIGVISDIHQDSNIAKEVIRRTIRNIVKHDVIGLVMAGDIGDYHHERESAINSFLELFPEKYHKNLALMLGNHDVRTGAKEDGSLDPDLIELYHAYLDTCSIAHYKNSMCIDTWIDKYHFLCLNTDVGLKDKMELNSTSLSWLKEKLAEDADYNKPIFVMTHQAFNSTHWRAGLFGGFGDQDEELKKIFLEYPQIVMLSGHIHNGFGVIEFIQRPFGTLIEIPSLTRSENGVCEDGTGYLLKITDDRLVFEAWNFNENIHLSEYDQTIYLPTLSVLAKESPDYNEGEGLALTTEANALMNRKYYNDIPSNDNTYQPPEYYDIDKIYGKDTWIKINNLRKKLIDFNDAIVFYPLPLNNGEVITEAMISDVLKDHDNIEINMNDGYWSPEIFLPPIDKTEQTIKIISDAGYSCTITTPQEKVNISRGNHFIFSAKGYWHLNQSTELEDNIEFYSLPFENGTQITKKMISDALEDNDNIEISMYDGHWVPDVFIPTINKTNKLIRIISDAGYKCTITTPTETILASRNDDFILTANGIWDLKIIK